MIVRPIKFKDFPAMQPLLAQLGYPSNVEAVQARFEHLCTLRDYDAFVAEENEAIVGMVGFIKQFAFEMDGPFVRIQALVVDEGHRNKGVAQALMEKVEMWARAQQCVVLTLNSGNRPEREAAHTFYRKLGFVGKSTGFSKLL
jgi:GNAT superfamily N-acetyltransferase